eukprot:7859365-Pyramimonas_sp.AAC.1
MMQEAHQAGTPAGGSDGSWVQAQSADPSGMTSSGVTLNDAQCASAPRRYQAQQLPALAGPPAAFAPASRAATPFGTPQSAGGTN